MNYKPNSDIWSNLGAIDWDVYAKQELLLIILRKLDLAPTPPYYTNTFNTLAINKPHMYTIIKDLNTENYNGNNDDL